MSRALILLADDDASVRRSLARLLRAHDYDVVEAETAGVALGVLAATTPAVILMDMIRPGDDAVETARRLKAEPRTAQIPIIALTASPPAPSDSVLFTAVLPKPCDPRALLEAIDCALKR